jgi:hypothetical protein
MKNLKYALMFFFIVDVAIFLVSQIAPILLVTLLPQFNIESVGGSYPRLVGILFLALGLARLYGGLYIEEKGAVTVSIWSWVIELAYIVTELIHGQFLISENLATLVLAPLMIVWSLYYYRKAFLPTDSN